MTSTPTVAVIGGGQLARMMAQAAVALGVPLRLLAEGPTVSAAQVVPDELVGDHLRRRDALGLGQQPQRDAHRRGGLGHHPRQLPTTDHRDGRRELGHA